jgi:hypothetical protein
VRTLRIALITCLVLSPLAFGEWRDIPGVTGQAPRDVWILDAGVFSVHTANTAYKMEDVPDGSVGVVPPSLNVATGQWVGSYLDATGCLTAVDNDGDRVDCASTSLDLLATGSITAFRATHRYAAYADGFRLGIPDQFHAPAGSLGTANALAPLNLSPASSPWLSALSVGTSDFGLLGRPFNSHLVEGGMALPSFTALSGLATGSDLSTARGGVVRGVLTRNHEGVMVTYDGAAITTSPFAIVGAPSVVGSVAYREGMGDAYGEGWGMAIVDGTVIFSAIPDPAAPAQTWVPSTVQPPAAQSGAWQVIRCLDPGYCVLASTNSTTGRNLISYRNAFRPAFDRPLTFSIDEGTSTDLLVDAGDPDGDAVFVTWSFDAGYTSLFTRLSSSPDGRRLTIDAPAGRPALCGVPSRTVAVDVFLSDGLASHVVSDAGTVTVMHTSVPPAPLDRTISVQAGTGTRPATLTQPVGVCSVVQDYTLQLPQRLATAVTPLGLDIRPRTFTPQATLCSAVPVSDTYQVRAYDGFLYSTAATLTVQVLPWGVPLPPFPAPRTARQDAGTTALYFPEATHACSTTPGFPGVTTSWSWDSGVPGASVALAGDGGVQVSTIECTAGTIVLTASNRTKDDAGIVSPAQTLTVDVFTDIQSIDGLPVNLTDLDAGTSGLVTGIVDVDLNCKPQRSLAADLRLLRPDGGVLAAISDGPLGPFALPAPGGCNGGDFLVEAVVRQGDGGTSATTRSGIIQTPFRAAGVDEIVAQDFKVVCGGPATTVATAVLDAGSCAAADVRWSAAGALSILPASGSQVTLETVDQDFGALIGQVVDVVATADAGLGNTGSLQAQLRVVADPFITVTHRTPDPVASESQLLSVEVTLTNTTACPVSEVELRESLEGMTFWPGTVRVDGAVVNAQLVAGDAGAPELVVPGLSLAGGGRVTVSYSARPALLREPAPRGHAELRQVRVSEPAGLNAGTSSCGCASGGLEGPALLALGLLVRALRKSATKSRTQSRLLGFRGNPLLRSHHERT